MLELSPRFPITWRLWSLPHSVQSVVIAEPQNSYLILINEDLSEPDQNVSLKLHIEALNNGLQYQDSITTFYQD